MLPYAFKFLTTGNQVACSAQAQAQIDRPASPDVWPRLSAVLDEVIVVATQGLRIKSCVNYCPSLDRVK
jgi:hypothetical protein